MTSALKLFFYTHLWFNYIGKLCTDYMLTKVDIIYEIRLIWIGAAYKSRSYVNLNSFDGKCACKSGHVLLNENLENDGKKIEFM